jgi:hypothetical protein
MRGDINAIVHPFSHELGLDLLTIRSRLLRPFVCISLDQAALIYHKSMIMLD